jgi:adenylate cyclase
MNYDVLEANYWQKQIERVEKLRSTISERATATPGRVIPDENDLAIGTGRRLPATVLFLDVSSFSQRNSITQDEQEMMLRVLNLFLTEMIRIIEDYGGNVEKNTGDGLMAYFEDLPEDDANTNSTKRALACSLTMDAANQNLISPILRATGVTPLRFRVTMDHGNVTIARIGAAQRFNSNVAIGNIANFAAHMLALIKPDDIALGASAWSRIPIDWSSRWGELSQVSTGWVYSETNFPYPLYLYKGRWARLI